MKYVDEFRDKELILTAAGKIRAQMPRRRLNIMEVCGTHTQSFFRFGLDKLLPRQLKLISGPGCPVCVSPQGYIDAAVELSSEQDFLILTFGDMLRVPGSLSSLEKARAGSGNVRVVYSPLESVRVALENPARRVVFLAVGFETTAPAIALSIIAAKKAKVKNLYFLSSLKLIPPAMRYLLKDQRVKIDGFLCPGHVSAIIGTRPYEFIPKIYKIGCCIAGFEPLDIMEGLYLLVRQIRERRACVENQYKRLVQRRGNIFAQRLMQKVFKVQDAPWRGFGIIPDSGLGIRREFSSFDAQRFFPQGLPVYEAGLKKKCACAEVLKGLLNPKQCVLFGKACTPQNPVGPCMVSSEGACNATYRYKR